VLLDKQTKKVNINLWSYF